MFLAGTDVCAQTFFRPVNDNVIRQNLKASDDAQTAAASVA
jgi:hypothetical protein